MIWGTRLDDPAEHLKQKNVLTFIQKVTKNPDAKDVMPIYNFLCEIAHPSVIGNTRFFSHVEQTYPDGSEHRVISKFANANYAEEILDKTIWSLGWSAYVLRKGFEITREGISDLREKLEKI